MRRHTDSGFADMFQERTSNRYFLPGAFRAGVGLKKRGYAQNDARRGYE
jgi:hypothetical protein